ncbi:lysine (K)-specific demethylase 2Aa isoform X2 [Syngnathoides biaculeatus]|uniref:lysine (K)-specific demethylase 2Aa isoform X2 n=1 Tax=Syngnathoides biaculeatus TaxID=300417 RepID=UPI002ADD59C2|nr:lysine (K)-specific demethylase 2Aa isoform X2 [Syngnathoides biaculeatus]
MGRSGTRRRYQEDVISDEEIDGRRMFDLEEKVYSQRFNSDRIIRMQGKDLTYEFIQRSGLRDPIIFEKIDGLGLKMPDPDFSVNDVKMFVGSRRMIDVMDVSTQKGTEMSMAQWTRYYESSSSQREKLYNVISLEFSHTKLENLVKRPSTLDLIDWVDNMWPRHLKERQRDSTNSISDMQYPKVQKYCLMSVEGCYTDFHIDFGGTSVWYHILKGSKVVWLIPPTAPNLELYEHWVLSGKQGDIFLGDRASDCQRIELRQGWTFIIPSGWIHAVYTPIDSIVFGGNFLHSFNIPMQLNICNIEDRTRVPVKFRHPFYNEMCWYVLERYIFSLTKTSYLTPEFQRLSLDIDPAFEDMEEEDKSVSEDDVSEQLCNKPAGQVNLTPLELEGLWNLVGKLESLPSNKKCVPPGIHNSLELITHIKAVLKEHANDDPKQSYTGKPIVRWPKRPLNYQSLPAPTPLHPKLVAAPVMPRPQKPSSSMSVLRRRRVRCKRCEACMRAECGDCNFCRDMKKFGGPGKLKQTCVLRQCLSPGLPLSAVCEICKEPNQDETGGGVFTLMECSNCAQIVHPACLTGEPGHPGEKPISTARSNIIGEIFGLLPYSNQVRGEGVINKDLPSCWECPKCVQGITDSEKRKCSSLLDSRMAKIFRQQRHSRDENDSSDDDEDEATQRKRVRIQRGGCHSSRRGFRTNRRGLLKGLSTHRGSSEGPLTLGTPSILKNKSGRRRGVRLRGGSKMQQRGASTEESDCDEEEEDDDSENGDQDQHPHHYNWRSRSHDDEGEESEKHEFDPEDEVMDLEDEDQEGPGDSDPEPPVLLMSDLNDDMLCGSYLTVTLQHPTKTNTISVPKMEAALGFKTPPVNACGQQIFNQKSSFSKPLRFKSDDNTRDCHTPQGSGRSSLRGIRSSVNQSVSTEEGEPVTSSVPPTLSLPSPLCISSFQDVDGSGGEKEVWVSVFRYLNKAELLNCMTVCKAWYKWSFDKHLWSHLNMSRFNQLNNQALAGIIKHQPTSLDLSWTPLAKRQLICLLTRLPGLRELRVAGLSWSCLSALVSPALPHLQLLDLRWCEGIKDTQFKELLTQHGSESSRSRLKNIVTLHLSGLDINESTLRLMQHHMPHLQKLDLAHCKNITDSSIALLAAGGARTRSNLNELILTGCYQLSDGCMSYLKRISSLTLLDIRGCKNISIQACNTFISDLSHVAVYCMIEEKVIQCLN